MRAAQNRCRASVERSFPRKIVSRQQGVTLTGVQCSTASYDPGVKLRTYDRAGVREVWLVDPAGPQGTEIRPEQVSGEC